MFHKKPILNIIDESDFANLNKTCQNLVVKAEKGDFKAIATVAKGFIYGKDDFPKCINLGLSYLQFGVEKDNAESLKLYGRYLLQGEIIDKNEIEAINILNNAASKTKNALVKLELAEILLSNQTFQIGSNANYNINYPLVKQLYKDAADYGKLKGITKYAKFCMKKKSCKFGQIERDFGEAFKYFKIAAEKGDKEAMFRYGEFLEKGVPQIPIDIIAAKNWYKKSYEGEDLGGYAEYGYTLISSKYGKTDEPEGYRLIKYSADHENPMGMLVYGHIIQSGMLCVQQDNKRAFELIKKAADMGEPNAITAIGMFYEKGIYVKQSSYTAIKYYKFALEEGSMIAIEHLGEVYKKGGDGFSASPMESRSYYKIGADAGLRESIYQYCLNMYNDDIVLNYIYEIRKYLEIKRRPFSKNEGSWRNVSQRIG